MVAHRQIIEPDVRTSVLVVDDHQPNQLTLQAILEPLHVHVVTASSGKEALRHLDQDDFAAILLDVRMPVMSGFETARQIKAHARAGATPIIFVTAGDGSRHEIKEAYAHGGADYLTKPFEPEVICGKIAVFVDLFRKTEELRKRSEAELASAALQRSLEHFRLLAEAIPQLVWSADGRGVLDYRNQAWTSYVGRDLADVTAADRQALIHPDDEATTTERWKEALATGGAFETVYRLRRHDGMYRYFLARAEPMRDGEGRVVKWFGTCTDIDEEKRAEQDRLILAEKLAAERALLTTVLAQMPWAVMITDAGGNMILSNERTTSIFRQPSSDESMKGWERFVGYHPDGRPVAAEEWPLSRSLGHGEIVRGEEVDIRRGDGTPGAIRIYSAPVRDDAGKIVAGVVTFDDVSEEKAAHDALQVSEERLQAILESATSAIYLKDLAGQHILVNKRYEEMTGRARAQLIGQPDEQIVGKETARVLRDADRRVAETGEPMQLERTFVQHGEERTYLTVKFPVRDAAGKVYAIGGMWTDITERRRAEDRLRFLAEASKALATSLDVTSTLKTIALYAVPRLGDWCAVELNLEGSGSEQIAVAHVDPKKVELAWELRGRYPPKMDAPSGVPAVLRGGPSELYPAVTDDMLKQGAIDEEHLRISRELGLRSALVVPIRSGDRTHGAFTLVSAESGRVYNQLDVALAEELGTRAALAIDNARLFEQARQAIRVRDDFLSVASHELKTPLTSMRLQLTTVSRAARDIAPAVVETVKRAQQGLDRLARLVEELLDVSRITAGRLVLTRAPVDLSVLAQEVVTNLGDEWQRAGCEVRLTSTGDTNGSWDASRLEQIVTNLVVNACKFGKGQPVDVAVSAAGNAVTLTVTDRGIGVSPEDQRRIFDRFERAVSSRHYGGLGLGLWISRQIVEAHGGTISVASEVGEGASFIVSLPRA